MSLLTDKEIQTAQDAVFATHKITWEGLVCDFLDPSMCSPSDVEQALIEMADAVADASQTATLKAVAEWLVSPCEEHDAFPGIRSNRLCCPDCMLPVIAAWREGQMPGEAE